MGAGSAHAACDARVTCCTELEDSFLVEVEVVGGAGVNGFGSCNGRAMLFSSSPSPESCSLLFSSTPPLSTKFPLGTGLCPISVVGVDKPSFGLYSVSDR